MSAFLVDQNHINFLVTWAAINDAYLYVNNRLYDVKQHEEAQKIATILYNENQRSLHARYGDDDKQSILFKYNGLARNAELVKVLKACDCFDYQACETDDYQHTVAADIINRIRGTAIRKLQGYDDAKGWDINDHVDDEFFDAPKLSDLEGNPEPGKLYNLF